MAEFFDILERKWIGSVAIPSVIGETEIGPVMYRGPNQETLKNKIFNHAVMAELGRCLDCAKAKTAQDAMSLRRIAWIRREFYEPLAARYEPESACGTMPKE